jgi:hypothetical protein
LKKLSQQCQLFFIFSSQEHFRKVQLKIYDV